MTPDSPLKLATGHIFIATSLEGIIARENGDIDWLDRPDLTEEDHGFDAFMASVDGLIMGRGTFEKVVSFDVDWPYSKPVVVLSRTLKDADIPEPLRDKVRISRLAPHELMAQVTDDGWSRVYVDGGQVIQSFLRANLIADMILTRIPVLLGAGLPLFGALDQDITLTHVETQSFPSGLVTSTYKIAG
jgi:dihydrofolate reductase